MCTCFGAWSALFCTYGDFVSLAHAKHENPFEISQRAKAFIQLEGLPDSRQPKAARSRSKGRSCMVARAVASFVQWAERRKAGNRKYYSGGKCECVCVQVKLEAEVRLDLLNSFCLLVYFRLHIFCCSCHSLHSFSFHFFFCLILFIPMAPVALPVAVPLNIY